MSKRKDGQECKAANGLISEQRAARQAAYRREPARQPARRAEPEPGPHTPSLGRAAGSKLAGCSSSSKKLRETPSGDIKSGIFGLSTRGYTLYFACDGRAWQRPQSSLRHKQMIISFHFVPLCNLHSPCPPRIPSTNHHHHPR